MKTSLPNLEDLVNQVESQQPTSNALQLLVDSVLVSEHLSELADQLIGHFVDQARHDGCSWSEIGQSLGVTKQAAQKRFVVGRSGTREKRRGFFHTLTDQARQAVIRAQEHARGAGSRQIDTGHLVLGLIDDPDSLGAQAIAATGAPLPQVRLAAEATVGPAGSPTKGHIPFSPDSKKVLQLALRETLRMGHKHIGTEHILLGVLRDEKSPGAIVLNEQGVTRQAVDAWILAKLET
ncbi:MAG: Clp protease N-terminal domain-containing protein [Acidimicrobiia bacterium]